MANACMADRDQPTRMRGFIHGAERNAHSQEGHRRFYPRQLFPLIHITPQRLARPEFLRTQAKSFQKLSSRDG